MNAVKTIRVLDPRLPREDEVTYICNDGPASVTYNSVTPNGDQTSLSPTFTVQAPAVTAGLNRVIRLRMQGTLTVVGVALNNFQATSGIALRQCPLQAIMQSCNLQLNDFTTSLGSLYQFSSALANVGNSSAAMAGVESTFPSIPDQMANYSFDVSQAGGVFARANTSPYSDQSFSGRTAQITGITYTGTTSMTISFDVSESLMITPLSFADNKFQKYLYGIQVLTLNISYSNAARMLSLAIPTGTTITSVTLAPALQALEMEYCFPSDNTLAMMPTAHRYGYQNVQYYVTQGQPLAAGASATLNSNSVEFAVIPSKFIVYATYGIGDLQDPTESYPDLMFSVNNCSIQFGQRSGLISGASQVKLYDIARKNGYKGTYPVWLGSQAITSVPLADGDVYPSYAGGPLIFDTAKDLSLPDGMVAGMNERIQFQVTINVTNQSNIAFAAPIRLVVIALTPGLMTIADGSTIGVLGGVTREEATRSRLAGIVYAEQLNADSNDMGYGGGFFSKLWSGVKSVGKKALDIGAPLLSVVAPEVGIPLMAAKKAFGGLVLGGKQLSLRHLRRQAFQKKACKKNGINPKKPAKMG